MLDIFMSYQYMQEKSYILHVVLEEFLGVPYVIRHHDKAEVYICRNNKKVTMPEILFGFNMSDWLTTRTMPNQPLQYIPITCDIYANFDTSNNFLYDKIPVLYGENSPIAISRISDDHVRISIDILGSAFFMLTRYEEVVQDIVDEHDRFPGKASVVFKAGIHMRPLVNEYLEVLWFCIHQLWPEIKRKKRCFTMRVSHDIDNPFEYKALPLVKATARLHRDIRAGAIGALFWDTLRTACGIVGLPHKDRYDTFDWLMQLSQMVNITSEFYFICGHSDSDPRYTVNHKAIRHLMRSIIARGHRIGIHPSYDTFLNHSKLVSEVNTLRSILLEEGYPYSELGGRQHYLRWKAPVTWESWEMAGLSYDSSVGFPDVVGFRAGVCYPFPTFNVVKRKRLRLMEIPLVVMEQSLLSTKYMNYSPLEAKRVMLDLLRVCKAYNGELTLLWHNSNLITEELRNVYKTVLQNSVEMR